MKRSLLVGVLLILFSIPVLAGEYLMNDTGQTVYGLTVTFSEPVTITGFGDVLMTVEPTGESTGFTFSGGELEAWGGHWLNWEPSSETLAGHVWIQYVSSGDSSSEDDMLQTLTVLETDLSESHMEEETYDVLFTSPNGDTVAVSVTRVKSEEAVPFSVEYRIELPAQYQVVAIADDPGVFEMPEDGHFNDDTVIPALVVSTFTDADKTSDLGTTWEFQHTDPDIAAFEVCKTGFGYGLIFNGNNGARLALDGIDGTRYDGVYINVAAGFAPKPYIDLAVGLDNCSATQRFSQQHNAPAVYLAPFEEFPGLPYADLQTLDLALSGNFPWGGITLYDVGFYVDLDEALGRVEPSGAFTFSFVFAVNSIDHNITLLLSDEAGNLYSYEETISFPLHTDTEILLDAEECFEGRQLSSAHWHLTNVDLAEDLEEEGMELVYKTAWPDVRDIVVTAVAEEGEVLTRRFYGLVFWRDGNPIENVGFQTIVPSILPKYRFDAVREKLSLAEQCGYTMMSYGLYWFYDWPDEDGNFTLKLIPGDDMRLQTDSSWALSDEGLATFLNEASELGMGLTVHLRQSCGFSNADLAAVYHTGDTGPDGECWTCDDGFLYGDGAGYWNQLMHYRDLFVDLDVDVVSFGAELVPMETGYYPDVRSFYSDAIDEWGGYAGRLTYYLLDWSPHRQLQWNVDNLRTNEQVLDPIRSSIPYEEMDLVSLNEYQILATRTDSSVQEMYEHALERITGYMRDLHKAYEKPLFIGDLVCAAYEGVLLAPPGNDAAMLERSRDDAAQVKYYIAWLRAFSHAIKDLGYDWIYGVTIGSLQMVPDQEFLGGEVSWSTNGGLKVTEANLKLRLLDTFRAYLTDDPVAEQP